MSEPDPHGLRECIYEISDFLDELQKRGYSFVTAIHALLAAGAIGLGVLRKNGVDPELINAALEYTRSLAAEPTRKDAS